MIENKDCWLKGSCNHKDCNGFCMRLFKLDYLYDKALVTLAQRQHIALTPEQCDVDAFDILKNIETNVEDFVKEGKSLYIHSSNCGNGKTSWSLRLLETYFNKIWHKSDLTCKALFINVPRFLIALRENISNKSEYIEHIRNNALNCDLVIWDEIGSKSFTSFEHENILNLVNARIDAGKANIYTSNLSGDELHEAIGDRLYSRIVNYSVDVELLGGDRRETK